MRTMNRSGLSNKLRHVVSWVLALACTISITLPAMAQDQQQQPVARPVPQRTVGLDPGNVVRWTLRDAIIAALDKNVDIELERENVRLAGYDIVAARGFYDFNVGSTFLYESAKRPNTFPFSGTTDNFTLNDTTTFNFTAFKNLEKYGSRVDASFSNRRVANNVNLFSPQFSPVLTVNLTQPIMRNYKIDTTRRQISINKKRLDLSDAQFRQRAIEIISRVQQAYWDLAFAIRDEEIQRQSVDLAATQLSNNQRQVEVGTLAPIDVVSAATQLESRRQQVFVAMNVVAQAENALKNLTVDGPQDGLWKAQIIPVESFEIKPVALPLTDAVKLAQENRPEVRQLFLQKEINNIDIDFFRNQAKPQVDFIASYGTLGLGGSPRSTTGPVQPFPEFVGGYGTSLKNMFKNDFRTWSVGLQFNFPLRNTTAKANLARARETDRQIELQNRRLLQNIELEVRNAVQAVETAKMRIEAAKAAREYAEQQYDGEKKKFAAGLSTTFFILQRQTEMSQAQGVELRALADYNKSVAELQRVIATTLSSNNIEIKSEEPVTIK
ncbi:MAG: TolC family protein [Acidobacteriota bacterium]|nr:MAG: TolC family protein [Acidobacteriota bacterium]